MKLKKVCLFLLVLLFLLLLNEISCIANNYNHENNFITDEDRRAADSYASDQVKSGANKRGLYETSGTHHSHQTYPSGYDAGYEGAATFSSPGHTYGPPAVPQYYPTYTTGHGSYGFAQSGHGGSGHGVGGYGYGHTAPAHGHGGHSGLALKGLLIPLAGIALLGAAAALSTNPVLLQLGVVNGRRRRRRSLSSYPNTYQVRT